MLPRVVGSVQQVLRTEHYGSCSLSREVRNSKGHARMWIDAQKGEECGVSSQWKAVLESEESGWQQRRQSSLQSSLAFVRTAFDQDRRAQRMETSFFQREKRSPARLKPSADPVCKLKEVLLKVRTQTEQRHARPRPWYEGTTWV